MSDRGAEEAGTTGADGQERRAGEGKRVHFEALVAIGEMVGGGFEAESIDVSPEGMRLRTAYLPAIGDKLVCRFDGMGAEVVAEGEVIWKNQEARGGEFGLRFIDLDPDTAEAVRAMCGSLGGSDEEAPTQEAQEAPQVPRGARVRLHIEGLGSPMKARVREAAAKELEVGSNLEFLKVGRSLELEDVDQGKRREATIAHVKVDIDPVTNVPQLVVSLRYDKEPSAEASAPALKNKGDKSEKRVSARPSSAPPTRRATETLTSEKVADPRKSRPSLAELASANDAESSAEDADESDAPPGVGARAAQAGRAVAGKIGPVLAGAGARAKGALGGILAAVQKKRTERAEATKVEAPRRTTSPAPGGALKSEGRRLVRDDAEDESNNDEAPPPAMRGPRRAAVGAAVGLILVLAIFGVSRAIGSHGSTTANAEGASTAAPALPAPSGAPVAAPAALAAVGAPGTPTANVPLFGATPLSTTEPVPAPTPSGAALAAAAPAPDGADGEAGDDAEAPSGSAGDGKSTAPLKEWGQGTVSHPVTLKLKMDGPIERINGAAGAMGFTISLPDRRSVSSTTDLARKDKRLASVNVVNTSHGAEVTIQFRDGVPPYLAKVKGDRLEIALGSEHGAKKVAKKKHDGDKDKAKPKGKKKHK